MAIGPHPKVPASTGLDRGWAFLWPGLVSPTQLSSLNPPPTRLVHSVFVLYFITCFIYTHVLKTNSEWNPVLLKTRELTQKPGRV